LEYISVGDRILLKWILRYRIGVRGLIWLRTGTGGELLWRR